MGGRPSATPWSVLRRAARGEPEDREEFARLYEPAVRAYLRARWKGDLWIQDVDDVVQNVFLACFGENGVLARADADRPGGFRAFLYGVVRNKALDWERRSSRVRVRSLEAAGGAEDYEADQESLGAAFDRAWARAVLQEAVLRQEELARARDEAARSRVELLRLRFNDGLPIREIAKRWGVERDHLHHEYARARRDYQKALAEVVAYHHPEATPAEVQRECRRLAEPFR